MLRFIVSAVILAAFVTGLAHMIMALSRSMHVWSFMVMCGAVCAVILALVLGWDWISRERKPQRSA